MTALTTLKSLPGGIRISAQNKAVLPQAIEPLQRKTLNRTAPNPQTLAQNPREP